MQARPPASPSNTVLTWQPPTLFGNPLSAQPPFFDVDADDAVNLGAMGAVVGHEMTHGFDDQARHTSPTRHTTQGKERGMVETRQAV